MNRNYRTSINYISGNHFLRIVDKYLFLTKSKKIKRNLKLIVACNYCQKTKLASFSPPLPFQNDSYCCYIVTTPSVSITERKECNSKLQRLDCPFLGLRAAECSRYWFSCYIHFRNLNKHDKRLSKSVDTRLPL